MTVAKFTQPDYTAQSGAQYPSNIDAAIAVHHRLAGAYAPHSAVTPNMTVVVDAGAMLSNGTLVENGQQTTATITAPATNPRIDRVVIDAITGTVSVITGAEAASPSAPAIPSGKIPVCQIALAVSTTAITNSLLTDERAMLVGVDYKEGTWTPSVGGTATYVIQEGYYTKIGRMVHVRGLMQINLIGTGNTVNISGLPFASGVATPLAVSADANLAAAAVSVSAIAAGSSVQIRHRTAASTGDTNNPILGNGSYIAFSGCYHV